MPCYRPLRAYYSKTLNPTGKRSLVFTPNDALSSDPEHQVELPCGQCIHCRLEKSRQWAMRCMHEASLYEKNCFVTLTYSDENLPLNGSLDYEAPVLFMKRLRDKFGSGIRSYGCAEYGEKGKRPHYHLCLFNHDFDDKRPFPGQKWGHDEHRLYNSSSLESLWDLGISSVGAFTWETAAYVARYVTKKITGKDAPDHYASTNAYTGEITERLPERSVCVSRRPGIGREWYSKFGKFIRDHDFAIVNGKKVRPAKYYDRLFDLDFPDAFEECKKKRKLEGTRAKEKFEKEFLGGSFQRTLVMEHVHELSANQLKRKLENGK